ncbi:MAG: SRPBCC family protein [Caulobacteraceae bacterium]|nr:SRPBCC family protein [Caulobacteraceae bacterium]
MTRPVSDAIEAHAAAKARIPPAATRSVAHATFHLERTYDASTARVWTALTDPAAKALWFGPPSGEVEIIERALDVRPAGRERLKGRWGGGVVSTFDATYYDVIANERLVYAYEMHLDDRKISVSVATIQLQADGKRTRLLVTEQGAFLDGYDDAGSRERGTAELLDALGRSLEAKA